MHNQIPSMAKNLALAAALLVAMLSLAAANTYTTTVTTTTIDDEDNQGRQQECQQQVQGRQFRSCQRYFQQGREGGPFDFVDGELLLALNRGKQSESLKECCNELRNVNEECRCEAIRQVVKEQQQGARGYQGEEIKEVYERARELPRRCQFTRPQQCQLNAVFV